MTAVFDPLPPAAAAYHCPQWFERYVTHVFARTWHAMPEHGPAPQPGVTKPWNLLAGSLDEPLVLSHDAAGAHLLSNVCPNDGTLLVERAGEREALVCSYGGERFALDGTPEDDSRSCEPLASVASSRFGPLRLASLDPAEPASAVLDPVRELLRDHPLALDLDELRDEPGPRREYTVGASWLVCIEAALRAGATGHFNALPLAWADDAAPDSAPDAPALRLWLWPTTELRLWTWGAVARMFVPQGPERTRMVVRHYRAPQGQPPADLDADLDAEQHAQQGLAESMARGRRARLWQRGRYASSGDEAIAWFHRLLATALAEHDRV